LIDTGEMWPDMSEYGAGERFAAPGFTYSIGSPAELLSSDDADTVKRHFEWMPAPGRPVSLEAVSSASRAVIPQLVRVLSPKAPCLSRLGEAAPPKTKALLKATDSP
jgi:hypothetical protein